MPFRVPVLPLVALAGLTSGALAQRAAAQPRASGRVVPLTVHSALYGADRAVWVYTPAGYDSTRPGGYPLLLAFDAEDYRSPAGMGLPGILDSLLAAGAAPAFVAVLIDNGSGARRTGELGNSARYARFLGEELVPWIRGHRNVTHDPHRTIITGSSAGGLGAAYAAFERPDLFGHVLSQSGAFWRGAEGSNDPPYEWLTDRYGRGPKRDIDLLLDVGAQETIHVLGGAGPVFIEANRRFRDALLARGYVVRYTEVPGGVHAPSTWRPRLPVDLVAIAGGWPR